VQAVGIIRVAWESGKTRIGSLLTKLMPGPWLTKELIGYVLWWNPFWIFGWIGDQESVDILLHLRLLYDNNILLL
jgi:hypothetical protein